MTRSALSSHSHYKQLLIACLLGVTMPILSFAQDISNATEPANGRPVPMIYEDMASDRIDARAARPSETAGISAVSVLHTRTDILNQTLHYSAAAPEITGTRLHIPAGIRTPVHFHTVPPVGYIINGSLKVAYGNGETRIYSAGDSLVEAVNILHQGEGLPPEGVDLVVFYLGNDNSVPTVSLPAAIDQDELSPATALKLILTERLAIMEDVARYKFAHDIPVEDTAREDNIVSAFVASAEQYGISAPQAEQLIRSQIAAAKTLQRQMISDLASGRSEMIRSPDLIHDIRPRLDRLAPVLLATYAAFEHYQMPPQAAQNFEAIPDRLAAYPAAWNIAISGLALPLQ